MAGWHRPIYDSPSFSPPGVNQKVPIPFSCVPSITSIRVVMHTETMAS